MKPARCTILLCIFISTSVHVSGNYVPIIRRTCCIYATLVFFTLYGWLSGLLVGMSIFISTSIHVSGNYVPIIRRTCCIYATLVFFTLYGWLSGMLVGMRPNQQTRQPPIQSEKYQCRINTASSPDDGHIVTRNMYRSWNKYTKKYCAPIGFIWKKKVMRC